MQTDLPGHAAGPRAGLPRLEPLTTARTRVLDVAYYEAGPADGDVVLLLHGFPYDIHSYVEVIPPLADAGLRVIVPYLRGSARRGSPTRPHRGRASRRHSVPTSST